MFMIIKQNALFSNNALQIQKVEKEATSRSYFHRFLRIECT